MIRGAQIAGMTLFSLIMAYSFVWSLKISLTDGLLIFVIADLSHIILILAADRAGKP